MNINDEILAIHEVFESISDKVVMSGTDERFCKTFRISDLPNHEDFTVNVNTPINSMDIFTDLNEIKCDCLYWFNLKTVEQAKELNNLLNKYRKTNAKESENYRNVPAKNKNDNSNVLYVGVRRGSFNKKQTLTNIAGRINQHLGYYRARSTQGLQLIHFAKNCDFDITINVVKIKIKSPNSMYLMYLNIIEKIVAQKLEPLCGRH